MNVATLLGFSSGFAVLAWAIIDATQDYTIFWNTSGMAIVLGGVVAATLVCYPLRDVLRLFRALTVVLRREDLPVIAYIEGLRGIAEQALLGGAVHLEKEIDAVENSFLQDGLRMVVDRYPQEKIRKIMGTNIRNSRDALLVDASILRSMARFAPAFGMVGTLIGLIVMFQNMGQDTATLGPAMAIAMMTTFYGVLLANLIFLPMAVKMERHIAERVLLMSIIMEGVMLVGKKTPPDLVTDELKAFLPAHKWSHIRRRKA